MSYLKFMDYNDRPRTLAQLKSNILQAIANNMPHVAQNVSVGLVQCIDAIRHIRHLHNVIIKTKKEPGVTVQTDLPLLLPVPQPTTDVSVSTASSHRTTRSPTYSTGTTTHHCCKVLNSQESPYNQIS
ncbi:hypothetical protein J6590_085056 [Homalodisca vitripennis]|nr:hypothetical protein J6590_085056 [Homalodisca vitripennis]